MAKGGGELVEPPPCGHLPALVRLFNSRPIGLTETSGVELGRLPQVLLRIRFIKPSQWHHKATFGRLCKEIAMMFLPLRCAHKNHF